MANQFRTNTALNTNTANNSFSGLWNLTRVMKKAGWIVKASSDGTTKDTSGVAANDKWGGNADPLADTYPTAFDTAAPWINMSGPITVKVPITSASTGTFLRGETVTQAGSGVEGEILGYVFDTNAASGWAIIADRTGVTSAYTNSWTTGVITGSTSGATLTPSATPKVFVRELVFWKNSANVTGGSVYYICADASAENASLFSVLATNANCTATIAPAGSPTAGNQFPALAICLRGTAAVPGGAAATHTDLFFATTGFGNFQAVAANAIPSSGVSADGTFWIAISNTTTGFFFWGFFRLDDTEPGDVEPFIWNYQDTTGFANYSRTSASGNASSAVYNFSDYSVTGTITWKGYIARGTGSTKDFSRGFKSANLNTFTTVPNIVTNSGDVQRLANHPAATAPLLREPVRVHTDPTTAKMYKGIVRWMALFPIGAVLDTFDTKQWLGIVAQNGAVNPCIGVGPYDGTTTPLF